MSLISSVGRWCVVIALLSSTLARAAQTHSLAEYRDYALVHDGDAVRGKALFQNVARTACLKCHSFDGSSSKAGPDLFAIGDKFPRPELIGAVLEPSAGIAVGYATTIIDTKDGGEFTGVIKAATASAIELIGADGKRVKIPTRDIQTQRTSARSLMPDGLQAALSLDEFADLIGYLTTLRQPANSLAAHADMPENIPMLAHPVVLQPFLKERITYPPGFTAQMGEVRNGLVWFGQIPGQSNVFLAVHETGRIWRITKNGTNEEKTLFLDISKQIFNESGPNGLMCLAFHPKFRHNRKYYLKHQVFENGKIVTTVVERTMSPDFMTDSGQPSRRIWSAAAVTQDHTGGCIAFGPDGYLYIGMGDTGPQTDPEGHGQNLSIPLAKMLRIDVNHRDPGLNYAIPRGNPFRKRPGARPEIWAYGLREPWRFSFDPVTGDLWVGDVGQDRVEEVDIIRRGGNYGWNVFEGFEPFSNQYRRPGEKYLPPVFAYRRKFGNSITGGCVYRGDKHSSFYGIYICGDYVSGRLFGLRQKGGLLQEAKQIGSFPQGLVSFGTDDHGEIYGVSYQGMVYHLDFSSANFNQ